MAERQRTAEEREELQELVLDTMEAIQGECVIDRARLCQHISACVALLDYAYAHRKIDEDEAIAKAAEYAYSTDLYCEYGTHVDKDGRTLCNFGQTRHPRSKKI